MRIDTKSTILDRPHGRGRLQQYPKEGSIPKTIYNFLLENAPNYVNVPKFCKENLNQTPKTSWKNYLNIFYGCDILVNPKNKKEYALIGEWFGKVYIDYTQSGD